MSYEAWGEPDGRPWPRNTRTRALPACMGGGWCAVRETCARYHQVGARHAPAERLCSPHKTELWQPILLTAVHAAEHHALALIHRSEAAMTPDQFAAMCGQARNLVARARAGDDVDEFTLEWAETLLEQNPDPVTTPREEKEQQPWL